MKFEILTAVICLLGWLAHWLASWGEAWKTDKKGLIDFIDDNPPAFFFSLIATVAVYLMGPAVFDVFGITLPVAFDDPSVKGVVAFFVGYTADSCVYKVANILPKKQ
jgi:hypothetical protein